MKYFSFDKLLKKDPQYIIAITGRGSGKSTDMARKLIEAYEENGEMFVMIRRRMGCRMALETWFDSFDFSATEKDNYDKDKDPFYKERNHVIEFHSSGQHKDMYTIDGQPFGYVVYLSLSNKVKSAVFDPKTTRIVLEEVIENGINDYISNEYSALMSIVSTVFRHRNGQVFILGNFLNEDSKQAPILRGFGIDVDRQDLKQGKVYQWGDGLTAAKVCFLWDSVAYEDETEVPVVQKVANNNVAINGQFEIDYDLFSQKYDYPELDFIRDSVDKFVIFDDDDSYYAVLNEDMQCIDWVKSDWDIHEMGAHGNKEEYDRLVKYKDVYIKQFEMAGEENPMGAYIKKLNSVIPYKLYTPLYDGEHRFGANIDFFMKGMKATYPGFTQRWCNGRIKYLTQNRIFKETGL